MIPVLPRYQIVEAVTLTLINYLAMIVAMDSTLIRAPNNALAVDKQWQAVVTVMNS